MNPRDGLIIHSQEFVLVVTIKDSHGLFGIGKEISRAFQEAENLLFQKEYQQASELFNWLCSMSFPALNSDTEEWDEMELEEM